MTLVDTNVLIDIISGDEHWLDWSVEAVGRALSVGPLFINDIVYAELASRYDEVEHLEADLLDLSAEHISIPRAALFLAGHVHATYRRAGGTRPGVLSDFFIGAHAAVLGIPVLTRDAARYRTYFPSLEVWAPQAN